jgi:hypothetical protein
MSQSPRKAGNGKKGEEGIEEPISAGRHCRSSSEPKWGQSVRGAGRVFFLKRDAVSRRSSDRMETKRDAREVDPRRAAEHRMALTEGFGPMAGRRERKTSEPSGHVVE